MAFVKRLRRDDRQIKALHPTMVECRYLLAEHDGRKILQLNTYGSEERQIPDKLSQTLQFDEKIARELWLLLEREFNFSVRQKGK